MANGYFDVFVGNRSEHYRIWWTDTPIPNTNKSNLNIVVKYYTHYETRSNGNARTCTVWVNDGSSEQRYDGSGYFPYNVRNTWSSEFLNVNQTITHDSDGRKTVKLWFKGQVQIKYSGTWYETAENKSYVPIQLTTIQSLPSTLSISGSSYYTNDTIMYNVTPKNSSARHSVTFWAKGKDREFSKKIYTKSSTSGNLTLTLNSSDQQTLLSQFNGKTMEAGLNLDTYVNDSRVGSQTAKFILKLPATEKPKLNSSNISITVDPTSEIKNEFVIGKSRARISISGVVASAGSSIRQYNIYLNGSKLYNSGNTATTNILYRSGLNTVTVDVIDSRGVASSQISKTFNVLPQPSLDSGMVFEVHRHNGSTIDEEGNKLLIVARGSTSNPLPNNTLTLKVYIKASDDNSSGNGTLVFNDTTGGDGGIDINEVLSATYDNSKSYVATAEFTDSFGNSRIFKKNIGTASVLLDISPTGVGIGKIFEGNKKEAQIGFKTIFYEDVEFKGAVKGVNTGQPISSTDTTTYNNLIQQTKSSLTHLINSEVSKVKEHSKLKSYNDWKYETGTDGHIKGYIAFNYSTGVFKESVNGINYSPSNTKVINLPPAIRNKSNIRVFADITDSDGALLIHRLTVADNAIHFSVIRLLGGTDSLDLKVNIMVVTD